MNNPINSEVFDTRDLIDYVDFLASELVDNWNNFRASFAEESEEPEYATDEFNADSIEDIYTTKGFEFADNATTLFDSFECAYSDEVEHYKKVMEFGEELQQYCSDYSYGASVIHEDYFTDYTEELVKDCGYIKSDLPNWIKIDWEATAEEVKCDYTAVSFGYSDYYVR